MRPVTPGLRLLCLAAGLFALHRPALADPIRLRVSLDTSPTHARNLSVKDFLQKLEVASGGRIKTEIFENGSLFPDRDILKALREGQVEMGAPLTFVMTGIVHDTNLFELPMFYGRPSSEVQPVMDGPVGQQINQEFEQRLSLKIVGRWLPSGFQDYFGTRKALNSYEDFRGLKVRNAGGQLQFARTQFLGAVPIRMTWPEVPLALSQGVFDAMATADDSVYVGRLWEAGVHYVFEDHQELVEYVPMMSRQFWTTLSPDLQTLVTKTWEDNIEAYRKQALDAADAAVGKLQAAGMKVVIPSPEMVGELRDRMMVHQDEWAKQADVSPALVRQVAEGFGIK